MKLLGILLTGDTEMTMIRQAFTRIFSSLLFIGAVAVLNGPAKAADSEEAERPRGRNYADSTSKSSYSLREYKKSGALRKDDQLERYMEQNQAGDDSPGTLSNRRTGYEKRDYGHKHGKSGTSSDYGSHRSYKGYRSPYGRDSRSPDGFGSARKR